MLTDVANACQSVGLLVNTKKTQWMSLNGAGTVKLGPTRLQRVNSFVYLGAQITVPRKGDKHPHDAELGRRIGCAWSVYNKARPLLRNPRIPMVTKRRYVHQCILPAILYGAEAWTLTKSAELRLARCERAMERSMTNTRRRDKKSNVWLRKTTLLKDFVVEYRKRKWRRARKVLTRQGEEQWDARVIRWTPPGKRPLGRPKTRWADKFKKMVGKDWATTNQKLWDSSFHSFVICD